MPKRIEYAGATIINSNRKWANARKRHRMGTYRLSKNHQKNIWPNLEKIWEVTRDYMDQDHGLRCRHTRVTSERDANLVAKAYAAGAFDPKDALRFLHAEDEYIRDFARASLGEDCPKRSSLYGI